MALATTPARQTRSLRPALRPIVWAMLCAVLVVSGPSAMLRASSASPIEGEPASAVGVRESSATPDWLARASDAIEAREYHATSMEKSGRVALQAPNRRHGLRAYFEPDGVRVVDRRAVGEPDLLTLRLVRAGRVDALTELAAGTLSSNAGRVEIERKGPVPLVEWFENDASGLEHGFTLTERPAGSGRLAFDVAIGGATSASRGDEVVFETEAGRRLRYSKLVAWDDAGRRLAATMTAPERDRIRIEVDDDGAVYPIVVDPLLTETFDGEIESNQVNARLRHVASAGDVNGDGYTDVIVGTGLYDVDGLVDAGAAFIFHGGPGGLGDGNPINADTVLESDQAGSGFGGSVASAGDVNGDGYDDVLVGGHLYETPGGPTDEGAVWLFLGGPDGIVDGGPASADAEFHSDQSGSQFGFSARAAGDVDGDGFGDILIGAFRYDVGQTDEGAAFLYYGGPQGLAGGTPATADARFESNQADARGGIEVASAGDVNGDGFGDIMVSADYYDGFFADEVDEGRVWVYYGSASGIPDGTPQTADAYVRSNQTNAQLGRSIASAGDVNGDGYGDVIVGAHRYDAPATDEGIALIVHGSATGLPIATIPDTADGWIQSDEPSAYLGYAVDSAGDVNGDGYGDVVVGAFDSDRPETNEGRGFIFLGGPDGIPADAHAFDSDGEFHGDQAGARFGIDVAGLGDVDGDGFDDFAFGAYLFDGPQANEGHVFVVHGGGLGVADGTFGDEHARLESNQVDALMGGSVASAGDVNGDGFDDVIVGAPFYDAGEEDEGAAFIFLGSDTGIADGSPATVHAQLESDQIGALFGGRVASAGDVNGDGYADVIVGASAFDSGESNEGAAFVFLGSAGGIPDASPATAHAQLESNQVDANMVRVASAGDVNGDGFSDVIVGARGFDSAFVDEGAAFVYLGSADGIVGLDPGSSHAQILGGQAFARLGASVASAGDVNGDGYSDVIIGADRYDVGQGDEGAALVFLGSASGIGDGEPATAQARFYGDDENDAAGHSVASAGDVNADGFDDVIVGVLGKSSAYILLGSAGGISDGGPGTADTELRGGTNTNLGTRVASAGDVNGDGFADVIAGGGGGSFLFPGSATGVADGIDGTAATLLSVGSSVSSAGDVNADGFADVIVGSSRFGGGQDDEGAAFVFLGGNDGRVVRARALRGDGSGVSVQDGGLSHAADVFAVEMHVTSPRGRERAGLEVEACPVGLAFGDPACRVATSPSWTDLGLGGATLALAVTDLPSGPYRWRVRARYVPLSSTQPGVVPIPRIGRWHERAAGGGTQNLIRVPEPAVGVSLLVGGALLIGLARQCRTRTSSRAKVGRSSTERTPSMKHRPILARVFVAMLCLAPTASASPVLELIARTGDPALDGNGEIHGFNQQVVLNDAGILGFTVGFRDAVTSDPNLDAAKYLTDGAGGLIQMARHDDPTPNGGTFHHARSFQALNESGQLAFSQSISSSALAGIFIADGVSPIIEVVRTGDPAPDGNGVFSSAIDNAYTFNDAGQIAFEASIDLQNGGTAFDEKAILVGDPAGSLVQLARFGDASPDGDGTFASLGESSINASGQVAFGASLTGTTATRGIYLGDATLGGISTIVRMGDAAPDGNGAFNFVSAGPLNDLGQIIIDGQLTGTAGGAADNGALVVGTTAGLDIVLREGDAAPGGIGAFGDPAAQMINDLGEIIFSSRLTSTTGGSLDDFGLFVVDTQTGDVVTVVREGDTAPDGNGEFSVIDRPAFNDAGQAVFSATLRNTNGGSGDNRALYFYDPVIGLVTIVREGDAVPSIGGTVGSNVVFTATGTVNTPVVGDEGMGLNDAGQVAFWLDLGNNEEAVVLWTIPEPGTATLLFLGLLGLGARRPRTA